MSKPQPKAYHRIMFIVEGIRQAVLVTRIGRRRQVEHRDFPTPEAALKWCRRNHAGLVYSPSPAGN